MFAASQLHFPSDISFCQVQRS